MRYIFGYSNFLQEEKKHAYPVGKDVFHVNSLCVTIAFTNS